MVYNFFISGAIDDYGPAEIIMSTMVIVIGVYLYLFSKKSIINGWLN